MEFLTFAPIVVICLFLIGFFVLYSQLNSKNQAQARFNGIVETQLKQILDDNESKQNEIKDDAKKIFEALSNTNQHYLNIQTTGKEMSDSLTKYINLLSKPQEIGKVGERIMETIVEDKLPKEMYDFQYSNLPGTRDRPDCFLHLKNPPGPICIDSKFPLDKYQKIADTEPGKDRDKEKKEFENHMVRRIKDIAKKYIIDGITAQHAIMFIPANSIYADIENYPRIVDEARRNSVTIVGPSTFMLVISAFLTLLKQAKMQESAREIFDAMHVLAKESLAIKSQGATLQKHFDNAQGTVDKLVVSTEKFHSNVEKLESPELLSAVSDKSAEFNDKVANGSAELQREDIANKLS